MKRFHVHLAVPDLDASVGFYSALFGTAPTVRKPDYAKWMLDDPRVNFAISARGAAPGLDHLGLQVEAPDELAGLRRRFAAAQDGAVIDAPDARCCYARSDKHWVTDPQGIAWEAFHTLDGIPTFGGAPAPAADDAPCCTRAAQPPSAAACCTPAKPAVAARAACC